MRIVKRAEWKARKPKSTPTWVPLSARTATCVHHDGPNPITVRTFAEACALIRKDQNYHMDGNGWADIGYNFLVVSAPGFPAIDGLIFEGRGRDVVGAHCLNWNTPWIGIQVAIGGGQTPSLKALASTRWLHDNLVADAKHPLAKKVHSDGFNTACPDPKLRAWVKAGMPVTTTAPLTTPDTEDEIMALTLLNPATKADATAASGLSSIWAYTFLNYKMLVELGKAAGIDVDEDAIASQVAALLAPTLTANVGALSDADVAEIAKAVADEQARRLVA